MRVGTRKPITAEYSVDRDHPHACGDKKYKLYITNFSKGSSPCVWGQGMSVVTYFIRPRIIPMRVGTSYLYV